jgi:hypothetical protein
MKQELSCVDLVEIIEQEEIFMAGAAEQTKRKRL